MSEDKKAEAGDWDEDHKEGASKSSSQNTEGKIKFMNLSEAGNYKIRLVGKHVKFYRHWSPIRAITHSDYRDEDPAWQAGFYPSKRFAINVIDRSDGEIKVLEKGNQIFKNFANYKNLFNVNPAGKDGPDFNIEVTIPMKNGKPNKRATTYTVTHLEKAPFTEEEIEKIKSERYDLASIFKSTPLDEIKKMWDELPESEKIKDENQTEGTSVKAAPAPAPVEENMNDAPAKDDDLFGDNGDSDSDDSGELF